MANNRGAARLDTWLSKLLWVLAQKNGGELRLPGTDLEDAPDKCGVVTDYDRTTHELRIIAVSGLSETIMVNTGKQWTRTENPNSTSQPVSPATQPQRSAVQDDATLALLEQRLMQRAARRRQEKEAEEVAAAHRSRE